MLTLEFVIISVSVTALASVLTWAAPESTFFSGVWEDA